MSAKQGLLERLAAGPVVGDGSFSFGLEKRGYVKAGEWLPYCTVKHPQAVRQLHADFLRAGADVMQSYNFNTAESNTKAGDNVPSGRDMNLAAYRLAREVADAGDALVSISLSMTVAYQQNQGKDKVQQELQNQLNFFKSEGCALDVIVCEYFSKVEEMEWAIEVAKKHGVPVMASMCIGPISDQGGVPTGECAVRMAKAGADVVGVNCKFGPKVSLKAMKQMKQALDKAGLKTYLMCQPLGFYTPEIEDQDGYLNLPELFLAYEPRVITRFEAQNFAREAFELGVHYVGGCCGFEPHHIRAMSEELSKERGKVAEITAEFGDILAGIRDHPSAAIRANSSSGYWKAMRPSTGRPESSAFSQVQASATVVTHTPKTFGLRVT